MNGLGKAIFKSCKLLLCNLDECMQEREGLEQRKRKAKPSFLLSLWSSKISGKFPKGPPESSAPEVDQQL